MRRLWKALVRRLSAARVDSIGLLGSTGTYAYLSRAERRRAIETAVSEAGDTPVMAGVGALRTDEAVALAKDAKAAGAGAGLLAPVSYTPLLDDEVFVHFQTVAGESGLPICIYNNPSVTHFTFSAELIQRLSAVPGVVAVKNPAPPADQVAAHIADLRARVPAASRSATAPTPTAPKRCSLAATAGTACWAGCSRRPLLALCSAAQSGDADETRRLNARLEPLWQLFRELTGLRLAYAAATALGVTAQPPRPVLPLPEPSQTRVARVITELALV